MDLIISCLSSSFKKNPSKIHCETCHYWIATNVHFGQIQWHILTNNIGKSRKCYTRINEKLYFGNNIHGDCTEISTTQNNVCWRNCVHQHFQRTQSDIGANGWTEILGFYSSNAMLFSEKMFLYDDEIIWNNIVGFLLICRQSFCRNGNVTATILL